MTIKSKILVDLEKLSPEMLGHTLQFIESLRKRKSNKKQSFMELAGTISKKDAMEMKGIIQKEFNNIEGEW